MHYVQSKSVPTNLAEWLADPDEFVRARAYRLLAFSTARDIREAIPRGLRDNSDEVRLATIEVIAQIGASIDWRLLQPTLYMDNPELQLAAVRALAELDATPALAMLRGLLARGRDPQLRRRILHTLPHYSAHAEALAIARQSLRDIDASVRVVAAEALAKMGEPQWREIIMGTREDQQRLSERLPEC
jgi:HEAT repeat protein